MKIGIDCRLYFESGNGRYIRNLVHFLQRLDHKNDYYLFVLKRDLNNLSFQSNFKTIEANFIWYSFSEQINFPILLRQYDLDLMHFPHFNVPLFYQGKFVVTIHDLIHHHFQVSGSTAHNKLTYLVKKFGYRKVFERAVWASCEIIAPSKVVKEQIVEHYQTDPEKITVTYEAVDPIFDELAKMNLKETFKFMQEKFNIKKPFMLYVGNAHPHKNLVRLLEAFNKVRKNLPRLSLVLSGKENFFWQKIKHLLSEGVVYTSFVSDEELGSLYQNALLYIEPSLEEGFGLPVVEAMRFGCPILCSNIGSLKEIAGEAAVYFDPYNLDDIKNKILVINQDSKERQRLSKAGIKRVNDFSWEELAKKTLEIYQRCG